MKAWIRFYDKLDRASRKTFRLPLPTLVFRVTFVLLLIIHCVENTSLIYEEGVDLTPMYRFRNALYAVLLIKAGFLSRYSRRELIAAGILYFTGAVTFLFSGDFVPAEFAVVLIAAKDEHPRDIMTVFGVTKALGTLFTLGLYFVGVLPELIYDNGWGELYNTYGFCHRNVLGVNVAVLCLCYFCLRFEKMNRYDALLWCALGFGSYFLSYSRTSLLIIGMIIVGAFVYRFLEPYLFRVPHMDLLLCGVAVLFFALSLVCTVLFDGDSRLWELIDSVFTKRFRFANACLEREGLSLFGQRLPFVSTLESYTTDVDKLILDNSYMRLLIYHGIVPCAVFLSSFVFAMKRATEPHRRNSALLFGLLVMAVYGMSERFMLDVNYNFPLLAAGIACFAHPDRRSRGEYKYPLTHAGALLAFLGAWYAKRRQSRT